MSNGRLFSGLRAAAAAFGKAVGGAARPTEPAPVADINRMVERLHRAHADRERSQAEALARDIELASSAGVSRPMTAELISLVRAYDTANSEEARKDITSRLRALSAEQRGELFDTIDMLRARFGWGPAVAIYVRSREGSIPPRFARFCETLSRDLLRSGFQANAPRTATALRLLANDQAGLHLKGTIGWSSGLPKLGIVREIERAVKHGLVPGPEDRANAARLIALVCDTQYYKNRTGPEKTDPPLIVSLKALAGAGQQDSFFARMRANPPGKLPHLRYTPPPSDKAEFWDDVLTELAPLFEDIRAYAGDRTVHNWLTDRQAFAARFGSGDGSAAFRFGWWARDTKGEEGFHKDYNNHLSRMLSQEKPEWRQLATAAQMAMLRAVGPTFDRGWPQDFTRAGTQVEAFEFGGGDPDGSLLNHLVAAGDGAPGTTWLKDCERKIAALGHDTVADGFRQWLKPLCEPALPEIDRDVYIGLEAYSLVFSPQNASVFPTPLPERESAGYAAAVRQSALKAICAIPGLLFQRAAGDYVPWQFDLGRLHGELSPDNVAVARGIALALSRLPADKALPLLESLAGATLIKTGHYGRTVRSQKTGAACVWSLGQLGTADAAYALGRLRRRIDDKVVIKSIDKALEAAGSKLGLSGDDMQEIAMAEYGIGDGGLRVEELGGVRVELRVVSSAKAELRSIDAKGKSSRGIAKDFKAAPGGSEMAGELEDAAKDIALILPEARRRIESAWRDGRHWNYQGWQDRLIGNGLLRTLSERLIWRFVGPKGEAFVAMPRGGGLVDHAGVRCPAPGPDWTVHLWHPLDSPATTVAAWRESLARQTIQQPFIQAWRPVYVVTDAELATQSYSNRFAAHILEQAPVMAILKKRGWTAYNRSMHGNNAEHERVRLILPHHGVAAEFWVAGIGTRVQDIEAAERGAALYAFIATDRVAFFALDPKTGQPNEVPLSVDAVPPRAFCEAMHDIDSVIGRTSIGNDRHWQDRGGNAGHPLSERPEFLDYRERYSAGRASGLAKGRRDFIATILPGLAIANQCTVTDEFLIVDGKRKTYKINFASGHIRMAPNDRYLCIVPSNEATGPRPAYVPFEGDDILSVILSKAMMLANDDKITDGSILTQIG
ncbi:DUF4132 domain-containing protein [Mesorhizobium abyssinicae]|uniref:DUF4132 domain-containing protein n=1 Tax=Mesorhizobium abyssinicae TaxID=1209958 RepID=UPI002A23B5C1|nr:DUF4132 domain-containing protein [Mesorhizobium abyssinicae]MDX8436664.1 DUF4132 domain-containing protein [Mesorhizobium abyssinicae]